jgi:hypothetical protein
MIVGLSQVIRRTQSMGETVAEETGALESLGKVIPSIYYDLIARVCAGVPFLIVLLWQYRETFGEITWAKLTLLIGAGYVVGLVLTSLSIIWSPVNFVLMAILKIPLNNWRHGLVRNDEIVAKDKEAGATLAKMQAEATLCQNLVDGLLMLIILNATSVFVVPAIAACSTACRWTTVLILGLAAIFRSAVYLGRQDHLYHLYVKAPEILQKSTST